MMASNKHADAAEEIVSEHGEWYVTEPHALPTLLGRAQVHATLALAQEIRALRIALCGEKRVPGGVLPDIAGEISRTGGVV
ncbi:hypothetical protein BAY59_35450 [Prauserella coralliicola]|nr:hypothetical protein BAY59_35450 [Prauserella coralliicola]